MQYGKLSDYPIRIEPKVWLRPDSTCHRTTDAASKSDWNTRRCTRQLLTPYTLHLFFPIACLGFLWEYRNRHHWHWRRRVLEDNEIISVDNICLFKHFQRTNPSHIFVVDFSRILPFLYPVPFITTPKCQILVKRKTSSPVKSQGKWLAEDIFSNAQVNWKNTYQLPFLCTTETKLWVFQFKFLQRRVASYLRMRQIRKQTPALLALVPQRHLHHFLAL